MTDLYDSKKNQARHDLAIKAGNDLIMPGEASAKKEIIEAAIIVLERALGEESVLKHLKDYVGEE